MQYYLPDSLLLSKKLYSNYFFDNFCFLNDIMLTYLPITVIQNVYNLLR